MQNLRACTVPKSAKSGPGILYVLPQVIDTELSANAQGLAHERSAHDVDLRVS